MTEQVTLILVGHEEVGKMKLINTFIENSNKCSNKKIDIGFASSQIKFKNRNVELNLQIINTNFSQFKGKKPSAVLFVYDLTKGESFKILNTLLEEVNKNFPNIRKVLVETNSNNNVEGQVSEKQIEDFKNTSWAKYYKVNKDDLPSLENVFIGTVKDVLGIYGEDEIIDEIINNEPAKEGVPKPNKKESISMLLVGEQYAEKHEIIFAFTKKGNESFDLTKGSKIIQVNNKSVELNLIEANAELTLLENNSVFNPSAILLVYDITKAETYKALKTKWYEAIIKYFPKAIKVLVGNNCVKYEEEKVNEEEARTYAKEIEASFYLVSPKKNHNIDNLFMDTANRVCSPGSTIRDEKKQKEMVNEKKSKEIGDSDNNVQKQDGKCCCIIV